MRLSKTLVAAAWLAALAGCTIIINPTTPPPPPGGGGFNPCVDTPESEAMPIAHLVVNVRIDRTVVNFEEDYAQWMRTTVFGLWAAGIRTTRAVMIDLDERSGPVKPLAAWGCDVGGFDLEPAQVLHHYAVAATGEAPGTACSLEPLLTAGRDLGALITEYPPELEGSSGQRVFGEAPDMVLALHLDSLPRGSSATDAACAEAHRLAESGADGAATWLRYPRPARSGLDGVALSKVFHWFVATDEGVDRDTFVARCRSVEGFPTQVLDVLEPSARALYTPLASEIGSSGGSAASLGLCQMFAERDRAAFFLEELSAIASEMDTTLDPDLLEQALSGELPLPAGGALPPGGEDRGS